MTVIEMARKNYERGTWTAEMLLALAGKGKLTQAQVETILGKARTSDGENATSGNFHKIPGGGLTTK